MGPRLRVSSRAATLLAVLLLASGCLTASPKEPVATATPIAKLKTADMIIPRQAFCQEVPKTAITTAIKGTVDNAREWTNGEEGATGDVAQEFGCEWKSEAGFTARAWVYARPITKKYAGRVIAETSAHQMCHPAAPPQFGAPSQLQICQLGGGVLRVRHAGLFGDAFLTCEVSEPTADVARLRGRADRWCVSVAQALDTND